MSMQPDVEDDLRGRVMTTLRQARTWSIAAGTALVVLGLLAVALPFVFTLAADLVAGVLLIVGGAVYGAHAAQSHPWTRALLHFILAALYLIAGVLLLLHPVAGALALTLVVGSYLVAVGAVRIAASAHARPQPGWVWGVLGGACSVILGVLLWTGWPSTGVWAIGLLVGIDLLLAGWTILLIPLAAPRVLAR